MHNFDNFFILASTNNDFKVTLTESFLTNIDYPPVNENKQFLWGKKICHMIGKFSSFLLSEFVLSRKY